MHLYQKASYKMPQELTNGNEVASNFDIRGIHTRTKAYHMSMKLTTLAINKETIIITDTIGLNITV